MQGLNHETLFTPIYFYLVAPSSDISTNEKYEIVCHLEMFPQMRNMTSSKIRGCFWEIFPKLNCVVEKESMLQISLLCSESDQTVLWLTDHYASDKAGAILLLYCPGWTMVWVSTQPYDIIQPHIMDLGWLRSLYEKSAHDGLQTEAGRKSLPTPG